MNKINLVFTDPDVRAAELDSYRGEIRVELLVTNEGNYNRLWFTKGELEIMLSAIENAEKFEDQTDFGGENLGSGQFFAAKFLQTEFSCEAQKFVQKILSGQRREEGDRIVAQLPIEIISQLTIDSVAQLPI